jgi:hypothetical protein
MQTMLQERHRPLFAALAPDEVEFVWNQVHQRWPEDTRGFYLAVPDPYDLFTLCQTAGLDHARVVLSLANLNGAARPVIEKLIGRPIRPWAATVEAETLAREEARGAARQQGAQPAGTGPATTLPASRPAPLATSRAPGKTDSRVVLAVAPNPYKGETAMRSGYECWRVGDTVQACRNRGMGRNNARRDVRRGYVQVGAPR